MSEQLMSERHKTQSHDQSDERHSKPRLSRILHRRSLFPPNKEERPLTPLPPFPLLWFSRQQEKETDQTERNIKYMAGGKAEQTRERYNENHRRLRQTESI